MDAERNKVASLQAEQLSLTRQLSSARTQEFAHRRGLIPQTHELEALRKWHARELLELEAEAQRRDRELHDVSTDLATTREDLERERSTSAMLKETLAQQCAAQASLQAENSSIQVQLAALSAANDGTAGTVSSLRMDLEIAQSRIDELEAEAREAEMVRRRLHNMVQELKGNIRVFARVRPLILSDLSSPNDEKARKEALANMLFPDTRDHREIVFSSTSESATGQERKETWNFSFDRVMSLVVCLMLRTVVLRPHRCLNLNAHKKRFSRKYHNWRKAARMVTMSVFSHMVRRDLASPSRWKEAR